ncbi:fibroblast growth factor 23 [Chanos chanos]|uniref:Fibroblast growth factor 23 n=1 Tax=Chanos chanos TaxID=29144 RepID=A0A6J2WEY0_CHACN|nr:fibroblast growth factor 23-like [Chanos chanos]
MSAALLLLRLSLALSLLHTPAISFPIQQNTVSSSGGARAGDSKAHGPPHFTVNIYNYFLEMRMSDDVKRIVQQGPQRTMSQKKLTSKGCLSMFSVRNQRFLCVDSNGKLYTSTDRKNQDCLFHYVREKKQREILLSCRDGTLLNLREFTAHAKSPGSAETSALYVLRRHDAPREHTQNRRKRSQEVDPSDPLGSENPDTRPTYDQKQDQDQDPQQASSISKETIRSCDDPLQVLLSNSPVSPNLEKDKHEEVQE